RAAGRRGVRVMASVEAALPLDGYSEVPRLVAAFRAAGIPAVQGAVGDLRRTRRGLRCRGHAVDFVYRDLGFEDIGRPRRAVAGFLECFDAGAVVPGVAGDFS